TPRHAAAPIDARAGARHSIDRDGGPAAGPRRIPRPDAGSATLPAGTGAAAATRPDPGRIQWSAHGSAIDALRVIYRTGDAAGCRCGGLLFRRGGRPIRRRVPLYAQHGRAAAF